MSAAAPIIRVSGLGKRFGRSRALDDLDLTVGANEVHGFLGPNGAGKSTTLRILLGLVEADAGTASIFGLDPWSEAVAIHRRIAYVPGDVSLWPNLTGGEHIDLLTGLRGGADPALREQLLREFELDPRKKARSYSKGNRQKVALVAAFARSAELYLFDEPTSGLDPVMESVFRAQVERVRAEGATVLLSSHILSEVEQLCDRVTIIRAGHAVETGSLADLRHLTRTTFRVTTEHDPAVFGAMPGVAAVRRESGVVEFDVDSDRLPDVIERVGALRPTDLLVAPPSLESLFLRHYAAEPEAELR